MNFIKFLDVFICVNCFGVEYIELLVKFSIFVLKFIQDFEFKIFKHHILKN